MTYSSRNQGILFNINLKSDQEAKDFLNSKKIKIDNPKNAEEQVLSTLGKDIYDGFFKNYTIKQWNTDPKNLHPSVTARIPFRYNTDDKYFNDKIQAMPAYGYYKLFENLFKGIEIRFNTDFFDIITDCYNPLLESGGKISAQVVSDHYWYDIGTIQSYIDANKYLLRLNNKKFLTGKGTYLDPSITLKDWVIIGNNVQIGRNSIIERSIIWGNTNIKAGVHVRDSIVTSNCTVSNNVINDIII